MKAENEYKLKYGHIPTGEIERYTYLLSTMKRPEISEKQAMEKIKEQQKKVKWNEIKYIIFLVPKGTPRPRHTRRGSFVYVVGAADNKKYFKDQIYKEEWGKIYTATQFCCKSYFPIPSSMSNSDKIMAEKKNLYNLAMPDFDNIVKTYTDMIKDTLMFDDRLIYKGTSEKYYSVKPRVEVFIKYLNDHDSDYNKKKILKAVESQERKLKL